MSGIVLWADEIDRIREQLRDHAWYRSLYDDMRARVETWIERRPAIPTTKGRAFYEACPVDHAWLVFDPYEPRRHVCSSCGRDWQGDTFDGAWVRQFQGWLGERLVEAGILFRLEGSARYADAVRAALMHFAVHYRDYPLADNLLGPTRLFQSTFLEAFWLVDVVAAYDLTHSSPAYTSSDHDAIRTLFYDSCDVIRSFDEGASNRQAFNNTGMGAVALLYDDDALLGHVLDGPHGFAFHMRESLTSDGIWYEGETYHFATLDHTLDLAEMARHRGIDLYHGESGYGSLRPMFDGPLKVMLPDLTFPSRKDSWFGRGAGYHREIFEIGFARYGDVRLGGLLARAYANEGVRTDLTWRAFLYLEPRLPVIEPGPTPRARVGASVAGLRQTDSERMPGAGVAVMRRDEGTVYVALEYGPYGGGHGHPDRMHLTLHADGVHWLLDPGTGFYHLSELGWYRSTLAHNTVALDGDSQNPCEGRLDAFGGAGGLHAAQAVVHGAYPGATLRRSLVLGDGFLLDAFDVTAADEHDVEWAFHVRGEVDLPARLCPLTQPPAPRGGHPFLRDLREDPESHHLDVRVVHGGGRLRVLQGGADRSFVARAMGIPLQEERPFHTFIQRRHGSRVRIVTMWLWGDAATHTDAASRDDDALVLRGERHRLLLDDDAGLAVVSERSGRTAAIAWFGRSRVVGPGLDLRCDHPLAEARLRWEAGALHADLPPAFGRVAIVGAALGDTNEVLGLPPGATWHHDAGGLLLEQERATRVWTGRGATADGAERPSPVAAGLAADVEVTVARYGRAAAPPTAEAAAATPPIVERSDGAPAAAPVLVHLDGPLSTWRATVQVPNASDPLEMRVVVDGESFAVGLDPVPPIDLRWRVESGAGRPELILEIEDRADRPGPIHCEVTAPWLTPAPRLHATTLAARGVTEVRMGLPLAPVPPTPPDGPSGPSAARSWRFPDAESAGAYGAVAFVRREEFTGVAAVRLPIAWCTPATRSPADGGGRSGGPGDEAARRDPIGRILLDRPEQVYRSERPWGGPVDASANASLSWDEEALTLDCLVHDDRHTPDGNDEDLYENDSLQLYLDFRPPHRQDSSFAPGVAAFVLAPDADLRGARIEPIAGSRELAHRALVAPWFSADGVGVDVEPRPGGYRLVARLPYASLGVRPVHAGDVFRADLSLSDNDGGPYRRSQLVWSGARGDRRCYLRWAYLDPAEYGYVIVGDGTVTRSGRAT